MKISLPDAEIDYFPAFIPMMQSMDIFDQLEQELNWRQEQITLYGKILDIPRLQAWYGDKNSQYQYSNLQLEPTPWHNKLLNIKTLIEAQVAHSFNSVLCNLYRDGKDSVAWHSDDEKELGHQPVIASVSFGGTREFQLKHKITGAKARLALHSGSLLVMRGKTQTYWQHCIAKTRKPTLGRINLTYREICK